MKKYRKQPAVIEAWQFTKENFKEGLPHEIYHNPDITLYSQFAGKVIYGEIKTPVSMQRVEENDYIIKGTDDTFYTCKPETFQELYREVEVKKQEKRRQLLLMITSAVSASIPWGLYLWWLTW